MNRSIAEEYNRAVYRNRMARFRGALMRSSSFSSRVAAAIVEPMQAGFWEWWFMGFGADRLTEAER